MPAAAPPGQRSPRPVSLHELPIEPEMNNLKTMDQADMDYIKGRYVDCAVRCKRRASAWSCSTAPTAT